MRNENVAFFSLVCSIHNIRFIRIKARRAVLKKNKKRPQRKSCCWSKTAVSNKGKIYFSHHHWMWMVSIAFGDIFHVRPLIILQSVSCYVVVYMKHEPHTWTRRRAYMCWPTFLRLTLANDSSGVPNLHKITRIPFHFICFSCPLPLNKCMCVCCM